MAFFIKAKTIPEAWHRLLSLIWTKGELRPKDEWGSDTKEIMNLVVNVTNPLQEPMIPEGYPWDKAKLEEYSKSEFLSADKKDFTYTYGERLHNYEGVDQISQVIARLRESKVTRRAVAVTWNPVLDLKSEEVPCLVLFDWKIRDRRLYQTTLIRSNDMYGAWPANAFGLARMLQHVSKEVGVEPGEVTTHSISAHIYSRDWELVKNILGIK